MSKSFVVYLWIPGTRITQEYKVRDTESGHQEV